MGPAALWFATRTVRPTTSASDHVVLLIAAGVPIKAIQERLGHASIVMTMDRYGHLLESVDEDLLLALDTRLPRATDG